MTFEMQRPELRSPKPGEVVKVASMQEADDLLKSYQQPRLREAIVRAAIAATAGMTASLHTGFPLAVSCMAEDIAEIEASIVSILARRNLA